MIVLYLDVLNPKSKALKERLEQASWVKNVQLTWEGETFEALLDKHNVDFIVIDYAYFVENAIIIRSIKEKHPKVFLITIFSEFFSKKRLEALLNDGGHDFITNSGFWDIEVYLLLKHMVACLDHQAALHQYKKSNECLKQENHDLEVILKQQKEQISLMKEQIQKTTMIDTHTELQTQASFKMALKVSMEDAFRHKDNVSLLSLMIDNHDHLLELCGKEGIKFLIKGVARVIKQSLRSGDSACIDEKENTFWILYRRIHARKVMMVVRRIKQNIEDKTFYYNKTHQMRVFLSVGVSSSINYHANTFDATEMLKRAKIALKNAIQKGGNTITAYG